MARTEIVLGIDDSPASRAALRWAADYARLTGGSLRAIHALPIVLAPVDSRLSKDATGHRVVPPEHVHESCRVRVTNTFNAVDPSPVWQLQFVEGDAGPALVGESEHSQLLVVGTREHTGLARVAIGSVSHYCLNHARCPVVAVPPTPVAVSAAPSVRNDPPTASSATSRRFD